MRSGACLRVFARESYRLDSESYAFDSESYHFP